MSVPTATGAWSGRGSNPPPGGHQSLGPNHRPPLSLCDHRVGVRQLSADDDLDYVFAGQVPDDPGEPVLLDRLRRDRLVADRARSCTRELVDLVDSHQPVRAWDRPVDEQISGSGPSSARPHDRQIRRLPPRAKISSPWVQRTSRCGHRQPRRNAPTNRPTSRQTKNAASAATSVSTADSINPSPSRGGDVRTGDTATGRAWSGTAPRRVPPAKRLAAGPNPSAVLRTGDLDHVARTTRPW